MTAEVAQGYTSYTLQEHAVWTDLYRQQIQLLRSRAAPELLEGRELLGIVDHSLPKFDEINLRLQPLAGWRVVSVDGMVEDEQMFEYLARRRFPASRHIRFREHLNYSPQPDIFHDVFGHVPLLTNPIFADYLQAYGKRGVEAKKAGKLERLTRVYFYTVEFGLIENAQGLRLYGSALATSKGEAEHALGPHAKRVPFNLKQILETPVHNGSFQQQYFVIESYRELSEAIHSPALLL